MKQIKLFSILIVVLLALAVPAALAKPTMTTYWLPSGTSDHTMYHGEQALLQISADVHPKEAPITNVLVDLYKDGKSVKTLYSHNFKPTSEFNKELDIFGNYTDLGRLNGKYVIKAFVNGIPAAEDSTLTVLNHAPKLSFSPTAKDYIYTVKLNENFKLTIDGSDEDKKDKLNFKLDSNTEGYYKGGLPEGFDHKLINDGKSVLVTGVGKTVGLHSVNVVLTDGIDTTERKIYFNVENNAPTIGTLENMKVSENGKLNFKVAVSDSDKGQKMTFEAGACDNTLLGSLNCFSMGVFGSTYSESKVSNLGVKFNKQTGEVTFEPDYDYLKHNWNTNAFDFKPYGATSKKFKLRFRANDGFSNTNWEYVTVTVSDTNRVPKHLSTDGSTDGEENKPIAFSLKFKDDDSEDRVVVSSKEKLPEGASVDIYGNFKWTPTYKQSGEHKIVFTATDKLDVVELPITINVKDVNQEPVLATIGNKEKHEGEEVKFKVVATDDDGDVLTYSTENTLLSDFFDTKTQIFSWVPDYTQSGIYKITFKVDDGKGGSDTETIELNILNTNKAPVLNPVGNKEITEDEPLVFTISASDVNKEDTLTYSVESTDLKGTSAIFDTLTQTFTWKPSFDDAGSYKVTFKVYDGELYGTETITIVVKEGNQAPTLNPVGDKGVKEGVKLSFKVTGTDPNKGDALTYSAESTELKDLNDKFDAKTQTFSWTPTLKDEGTYKVTFKVTDGKLSSSEEITITVGNDNQFPVLEQIGDQNVKEEEELTFVVKASDFDGDVLTYWATGDLKDNFDPLTQTFTWTPTTDDSGTYNIVFKVTDGEFTTFLPVKIIVSDVPQIPVMDKIGDKSVKEETELSFKVTATDPNGDKLTYSVESTELKDVASKFDVATQTFTWKPTIDDAGDYKVTFKVTDGQFNASETITITVGDVNQAPVFEKIGDKTLKEGEKLTFIVNATDLDKEPLTYDVDSTDLKNVKTMFDATTQTFTWETTLDDSGTYKVDFKVTDGNATTSETITITVGNVNQAPVLAKIGDKAVKEGEALSFKVSASDVDGDALTYSVESVDLKDTKSEFDPLTQTFSWTPTFKEAGDYKATFKVTDGEFTASETITITVGDVNQAPTLGAIGAKSVKEGELLSFQVSASDADNNDLTLIVEGIPTGATVVNGLFNWIPSFTQSGEHKVTFTVKDEAGASASEVVTITVDNVNRGPVITSTPPTSVAVGSTYSYQVVATDEDGDKLTYSVAPNPYGIYIDSNGLLKYYTNFPGYVSITVYVSDGETVVSQTFTVSSISFEQNLKISHVHLGPEVAYAGEYITVNTGVDNNGNVDLENLKTTVLIYDLGLKRSSGKFDLGVGGRTSKNVNVQLPYYTPPGVYLVKVTVGNDDFHDTSYRQLVVY